MAERTSGDWGEDVAADHLARLGYEVRARNFQTRGRDEFGYAQGEVDIVAERGDVLVFVEVRARRTAVFGGPEETITAAKRRRVVHAALAWLTHHQIHDRAVRFDVISVVKGATGTTVQHLEDAFDAGR